MIAEMPLTRLEPLDQISEQAFDEEGGGLIIRPLRLHVASTSQ